MFFGIIYSVSKEKDGVLSSVSYANPDTKDYDH